MPPQNVEVVAVVEGVHVYGEILAILMRWTQTESWKRGQYTTQQPSKRLLADLEPYRMTPEAWWRKVTGLVASG